MTHSRTSTCGLETGSLHFASILVVHGMVTYADQIRQPTRQTRTHGSLAQGEYFYLDAKLGISSWGEEDPIYHGPSSGSSGGSSGSSPNLPPIGHEQEQVRQGRLSPEVFRALAHPGPLQQEAMRVVNEEWERAHPSVRPNPIAPRRLPVRAAATAALDPAPFPVGPSHFTFRTGHQSQQICPAQRDRFFETDNVCCVECWQECLFPEVPPRAWSPGDWLCPHCRQHNFSARGRCYNPGCKAPRPALLYAYARAGPPADLRDQDRRVRRFQHDLLGRDRHPTRPPPRPPSMSTPKYAESSRMGQLRAAGSWHGSRSGPG